MQVILHHYIVWPSTPILVFRKKGEKKPLFDRAFKLKKTQNLRLAHQRLEEKCTGEHGCFKTERSSNNEVSL